MSVTADDHIIGVPAERIFMCVELDARADGHRAGIVGAQVGAVEQYDSAVICIDEADARFLVELGYDALHVRYSGHGALSRNA